MKIEKNGQIYDITETEKGWTLRLQTLGRVAASLFVSKADCPTFEDLSVFVMENAVL